jgi:cobalt/nickel transport system permease protein
VHKEHDSLLNHHRYRQSTAFSSLKSDQLATVIVPILLLLILSVVSVEKFNITAVLVYGAFPLFSVIAFRLPFKLILYRLIMISPFILIMAAANPFFDRQVFGVVAGATLTNGMVSGLVIVAKSFVIISSMLVFSMCIQFTSLCKVLHLLHVPKVFVTQLLLLNRYLFLLVDEARGMQKARSMRSFDGKGNSFFVIAKLIGSLLLRTTVHADHIYRAMVARGFNGDIVNYPTVKFTAKSIMMIALFGGIFLLIRVVF